jgi:hypothetical protein
MNAAPRADAYAKKTPTWQLTVSPAVPVYWRATPHDLAPFSRKPVSSTMRTPVASSPRWSRTPSASQAAALSRRCPPWTGLAHRFGELPAVLALRPVEQPRQVTPRPLARFGAGEPVGDPGVQLRPRVRAPRDRRQPCVANHRVRPLSSAQRRWVPRRPAKCRCREDYETPGELSRKRRESRFDMTHRAPPEATDNMHQARRDDTRYAATRCNPLSTPRHPLDNTLNDGCTRPHDPCRIR